MRLQQICCYFSSIFSWTAGGDTFKNMCGHSHNIPSRRKVDFLTFCRLGCRGVHPGRTILFFVDWHLSTGLELIKICRLGFMLLKPCYLRISNRSLQGNNEPARMGTRVRYLVVTYFLGASAVTDFLRWLMCWKTLLVGLQSVSLLQVRPLWFPKLEGGAQTTQA